MKNYCNNLTAISDFIDESSINDLKNECIKICKCKGSDKNFWYSFDNAPTNIIENYIFKTIQTINYSNPVAGAEWWVRVFNESNMDHPFHLDLDVTLSREKHIVNVPDFSSVLYLSWDGGPTVITNCQKYEDTQNFEYYPEIPDVVWMSNPKPGKLTFWYKPYIHGVFGGPNIFGPRVTLMFNLWKQKPLEPECTLYYLNHQISNNKITINNTDIDSIPAIIGKDPVDLNLKGDRNPVKCFLYNGLPLGGTYMIIN